ncbi:hypothetical protein JTB14_007726 [Gonioctena quinquepunctata]|nr:hypothetical protein JTB14_007726 [Gonioctena quinquepunctata]
MSKRYKMNNIMMGPPGYDDHHTLKDRHGMMCAIHHSSANFPNNFPCSQHQILHICPPPSPADKENKKPTSLKMRTRSKSPVKKKNISFPCRNWGTVLETSAQVSRNTGDQALSHHLQYPVINSIETNVERVNSCPDQTCSCGSDSQSTGPKRCSIKSLSTVKVTDLSPVRYQEIRHKIHSDPVVNGLKDEIEKVKSQLEQISVSNSGKVKSGGRGEPEKQISHLKSENKQLKKELEQKKKQYLASMKDVERAKDILSDYEKKVYLLHEQALHSSKIMKQSKDKFCKCITQKDKMIKDLKESNDNLLRTIDDKEGKYSDLSSTFENMQEAFRKNSTQYVTLSDNSKHFAGAIQLLEKQLEKPLKDTEQYKEEVNRLEKQLADFASKTYMEMEAKAKKQKEKYSYRIKEHEGKEKQLNERISELSSEIEIVNAQKSSYEELQNQCKDLEAKLKEYEEYASKYTSLEEKYQQQCDSAVNNEMKFEKDREELRALIDELTYVVKQNKATLLQLSEINKQQETVIASQSAILLEKEEMMQIAESEIDMLRKRSMELESEINNLKNALNGPCSKEACISLSEELEDMKMALSREKDNEMLKEKIIQGQSQTIADLHNQIKAKMSELSRVREESNIAEDEIVKMNDDLMRKHMDLEREMSEKELLMQKMKVRY